MAKYVVTVRIDTDRTKEELREYFLGRGCEEVLDIREETPEFPMRIIYSLREGRYYTEDRRIIGTTSETDPERFEEGWRVELGGRPVIFERLD